MPSVGAQCGASWAFCWAQSFVRCAFGSLLCAPRHSAARAARLRCTHAQVLPHVVSLCERVAAQQAEAAAAAGDGWARADLTSLTDAITLDVIGHVSYGRDFGAVEHK